ncbi:MAG: hypothetical protein ING18_10095 [Burkholderiales bacterium]|nr:hypothetical protein [Burkholderiales bacterium]
MCPSSDNDCKRQYVYGLYDKQTGRPLPGYGVTVVLALLKAAATSDLLQTDQPAWLNGLQSRYRNFFTGVGSWHAWLIASN